MKRSMITLVSCCLLAFACQKNEAQSEAPKETSAKKETPKSTLALSVPSIPAGTFNILNYGGSTSSSDNTSAVVQAVNAASAAGGGTVIIPAGTFLCGPFVLKNNVGLQLSSGTILKLLPYGTYPGSGNTGDLAPFIKLDGLTNVKVSGSGTIEGQGSAWWSAFLSTKGTPQQIGRPAIIGFAGANTVEISGITMRNAPTTHIGIGKNGNNTTISGVTITTPDTAPNSDGISVWSPGVNIVNCNVSCGDDNVAMNTGAEYVTISGCAFSLGHGLSIGSYASGIDHVTVDNCTFNGTDNGIRMKTSRTRSGTVQYLTYSNLTMTNVPSPFSISEYYPDNTVPSSPGSDPAQAVTSTTPVWKHFIFKNITATGAQNAGLLWAVPEKPMSDIVFDNVKITAVKGMTANYVTGMSWINGSKITVSSGNAFVSTYASTITGINLTTGNPQ